MKLKLVLVGLLFTINLFADYVKPVFSNYYLEISKYVDLENCNKINRDIFEVCYNTDKKRSDAGWTIINSEFMDLINLKKRPNFYKDKEVQTLSPTQIKNPLHKGHTFAKDEDFDYIQESLKSTYNMINITPMYGKINIGIWRKIENRGRTLAKDFGPIISITKINYMNDSKFGIPAGKYPKEFIRIYIGPNFEECYKSGNDINENNNLLEHKIECKEIK